MIFSVLKMLAGTSTLWVKTDSCPLCPHPWGGGQKGQELSFILNSFHSISSEEAFPGIVDSLVQEHSSEDKPPDPQVCILLLGDQYTKHCYSGKEFEDQNLSLWRNIHVHKCTLRGSICPPRPRFAQASLAASIAALLFLCD